MNVAWPLLHASWQYGVCRLQGGGRSFDLIVCAFARRTEPRYLYLMAILVEQGKEQQWSFGGFLEMPWEATATQGIRAGEILFSPTAYSFSLEGWRISLEFMHLHDPVELPDADPNDPVPYGSMVAVRVTGGHCVDEVSGASFAIEGSGIVEWGTKPVFPKDFARYPNIWLHLPLDGERYLLFFKVPFKAGMHTRALLVSKGVASWAVLDDRAITFKEKNFIWTLAIPEHHTQFMLHPVWRSPEIRGKSFFAPRTWAGVVAYDGEIDGLRATGTAYLCKSYGQNIFLRFTLFLGSLGLWIFSDRKTNKD